jgi:glutamine synthetase adenylyltransferase
MGTRNVGSMRVVGVTSSTPPWRRATRRFRSATGKPRNRGDGPCDAYGRRRLATLVPRVLAAVARVGAAGGADGQPVLTRLLRVVEAIAGRTAYLALLNENAQALERLVQACRMGDYLARQVAAHPLLLDELLDARIFETLPDRTQFAAELRRSFRLRCTIFMMRFAVDRTRMILKRSSSAWREQADAWSQWGSTISPQIRPLRSSERLSK